MGLRHVKFEAVEQTYESIHLNQYLDLYETIGASIGRKKHLTLTETHIHILSILDEIITDLLNRIESVVDSISIRPYQMRYTSAKQTVIRNLKHLYHTQKLEIHEVAHTDLIREVLY